jgi:hypothetical protein
MTGFTSQAISPPAPTATRASRDPMATARRWGFT